MIKETFPTQMNSKVIKKVAPPIFTWPPPFQGYPTQVTQFLEGPTPLFNKGRVGGLTTVNQQIAGPKLS